MVSFAACFSPSRAEVGTLPLGILCHPQTLKSSRTSRRDPGWFMMRRKAPCTATPISTSSSSWLPSTWWWLWPAGSTMKMPPLRPSSQAGPSSGSRWPPAGCVCCCTCRPWWPLSAVPPGSSLCEDVQVPCGSAGLCPLWRAALWTCAPGV